MSVSEKPRYPFEPGVFGINFDSLKPGKGIYREGNRPLNYQIDPDRLAVSDIEMPYFRMEAYRLPKFGEGAFGMTIHTKRPNDKSNWKHPDMRAKEFVAYAIWHLEQGGPLTTLIDEWRESSENYKEYMEATGSDLPPFEAAKNTWTYRTVSPYGFTLVTRAQPHDEQKAILVTLQRP